MSQRIVYVHLPRFPVQHRVLEEPGLAGQPLALVHETKGVRRVAFASGFRNEKAFARAFKQWTGETPSAFRKRTSKT